MRIFNRIKLSRSGLRLEQGYQAERQALSFLSEHGLRHVHSNYRTPHGEIDLIMQDSIYLVFVEVRFRARSDYGGAAASIDWRKQERLRRTAESYLQKHRIDRPCRFDVVLLGPSNSSQCEWIRDAF